MVAVAAALMRGVYVVSSDSCKYAEDLVLHKVAGGGSTSTVGRGQLRVCVVVGVVGAWKGAGGS